MPKSPSAKKGTSPDSKKTNGEDKPNNAATAAPKPEKVSKPKKKKEVRTVLYPEISSRLCVGKDALTEEQCKTLLGWQEETDTVKFGGDYLIKDQNDKKVRCFNNVKNRPIYGGSLQTLTQEHLRRRWNFNGEPIIVGATGQILNGQHSLLSLIFAAQLWQKDERWKAFWKTAPVMEKLVVFGVSEDDAVVNTMDTCKPRSLADVIYRSEYFANVESKGRRVVARMADYAIRLLWHRTGASSDAFAPRRTHSESLDFIARHERILECVKHVYEEDGKESSLGRYVSPGYAAGLLFLQSCANSKRDDYTNERNANALDWSLWDKACEFWVLLAGNAAEMSVVKKVLTQRLQSAGSVSVAERCALLVKAWNVWSSGKRVTDSSIALKFEDNADGIPTLAECPVVGGIDVGSPSADEDDADDTAADMP